jgi:hypothetical protein
MTARIYFSPVLRTDRIPKSVGRIVKLACSAALDGSNGSESERNPTQRHAEKLLRRP